MSLEESIHKQMLQDLDGQDWGEPTYPSHVVMEYHRLRRVPLEKLNVEDLRLLIGQPISLQYLEYLLPLAFEQLQSDPWVSGDYYEGDLLNNVLGVPTLFWQSHPELKRLFDCIVQKVLNQVAEAEPQEREVYAAGVLGRLERWQ